MNMTSNTKEFVAKAKLVHGDTYLYDQVNYTGCKMDIVIICRKHGLFVQSASNHLKGSGCPLCINKTEGKVKQFLETHSTSVIHNKRWSEILGSKRPDFRIDSMKLIIEYDGQGHFRDIAERSPALQTQKVDIWKTIKSIRAGFSVIHIPYTLLYKDNWEELLLLYIRMYTRPVCIWIRCNNIDLYDSHRGLYREYKDLSDDDLDSLLEA